MNQLQYELSKRGTELIVNSDLTDLENALATRSGAEAFLTTFTFSQARFSGNGWVNLLSYKRGERIDDVSKELFNIHRKWYVKNLLSENIPHFNRPNKIELQPVAVAYIDDNDMDSPRPHIHCIIVTENERIKEWMLSQRAQHAWMQCEYRGEYHVVKIDDGELKNTHHYNAKYYHKRNNSSAAMHLCRKFPELNSVD